MNLLAREDGLLQLIRTSDQFPSQAQPATRIAHRPWTLKSRPSQLPEEYAYCSLWPLTPSSARCGRTKSGHILKYLFQRQSKQSSLLTVLRVWGFDHCGSMTSGRCSQIQKVNR